MADQPGQREAPADAANIGRALPHNIWQSGELQVSQSGAPMSAAPGSPIRDLACVMCADILLGDPFWTVTVVDAAPCELGSINHIPSVTVAIHASHKMPSDEQLVRMILLATSVCFGVSQGG